MIITITVPCLIWKSHTTLNKSLTYKQKNKYLLFAALASLILVYMLALRNTLVLYQENSKLEVFVNSHKSSEQKYADLKLRSEQINSQVKKYFADSATHDENLIKVVSELCHSEGVLLKEMPLIEKTKQGNYAIYTNRLVLEGGYHSLLKVLHQLENRQSVGRIASVQYKTYTDHKKKKEVLTLLLHIQTIID